MKQTQRVDAQETKPAASQQIVQWVVQARNGDRTAFHRLVDRFQPEIFRMIFYRTRSQTDAEDLTQDVFLKAFKNLKRLKSAKVFRSWLYSIAVNRVRDFFRKKRFRSLFGSTSIDDDNYMETDEIAVAPQAPVEMDKKAFWKQVREAMNALSGMEREVFTLRFFDELSIKEMSAALNKNQSTVKTHLYRALRKVKDKFTDMDGIREGI